jgi:hypothetical protein
VGETLCDWKKRDIEKRFDELVSIIAGPRFVCRKCARVAHGGKYLCKPKRLPRAHEKKP